MFKYKKTWKEANEVDKVFCNCCGHEIKDNGFGIPHAELDATWGYGTNKDCEEHSSEICEKCYDDIIAKFKIKPNIVNRI